jgi:hypothetical protein
MAPDVLLMILLIRMQLLREMMSSPSATTILGSVAMILVVMVSRLLDLDL